MKVSRQKRRQRQNHPLESLYVQGGYGGYDGLVQASFPSRGYGDVHYLLLAHSLGGACRVDKPQCRASLQRAGLMEAAPYVNLGPRSWRSDRNTMRLTKAGQHRVKQIEEALNAQRPLSFWKQLRRNYHKAVNKQ